MSLKGVPSPRAHESDQLAMLLVGICVGLAFLLFFLWWTAHTQIATAIMAVQNVELDVIGFFTHRYDLLHQELRQANPAMVKPGALWTLCTITGSLLRWPVLLVILVLVGLCMTKAPREMYRRRFGIDGMQAILTRMHPLGAAWPGTALPLVDPAPPEQPLRPMDPALRRNEWIARFVGNATGEEARAHARRALGQQLGRPWKGLDGLDDAGTCLFLAFALLLRREKEEAQAVLDSLPLALAKRRGRAAPEQPLTLPASFRKGLDQRIQKTDLSEALALASRHAWTRPALMTLLQEARLRCGVVNPGRFAAVQLVDRDLWLVLAAVSYPRHGLPCYLMSITSCVEASAAIEHWTAECARQVPLVEPHITTTLNALDLR